MKKIFSISLTVILAAAFLAGCQPTPDNSAVSQKDLEQMLALAASGQNTTGSLTERLGIPSRYEAHVKNKKGNLNVAIDADIILPKTNAVPLVRVEAHPFGQPVVDKLIAALFKEGKLYESDALSEMTKSEISERLVQLKLRKAELERQGMKPLNQPLSPNSGESDSGIGAFEAESKSSSKKDEAAAVSMNQLDMVIESIKGMEELIKTAPDEKQLVETSGNLENTSDSIKSAHVAQLNPEGGMCALHVVNNERQNSYWAEYINRGDFEPTFGSYYTEELWSKMSKESDRAEADALAFPVITAEEARQIAERFLEQIGVDYLVSERSEKVIGSSSVEYGDGTRSGNLIKAYQFQYVRQIDGVPVTYTSTETAMDWGDSTVWSWDYETMTLVVDDGGIAGMSWHAPYKLTETITDNTAMLPFSRIREVFEKMILIDHSDDAEEGGADINITEVRLGLARIWEQNNLKNGLLIPVWDFFGTRTVYFEDKDGQPKSYTDQWPGQTLLTVNAIDGSIIDRSEGY